MNESCCLYIDIIKKDGIQIYRYDYNNGTIAGQVFIPKDAVPDLINFLSTVK
jgi:hypothetical protein